LQELITSNLVSRTLKDQNYSKQSCNQKWMVMSAVLMWSNLNCKCFETWHARK